MTWQKQVYSGVCVCGHAWMAHHGQMVMKQEYVDATGESLIAGACLHYGCNEREGLAPHHVYRDHDLCESRANCTRVHAYQPHCFEYRDQDAPA